MERNKIIRQIPESIEPEPKGDKVIAVSAVTYVNGKDYLSIDLWWQGQLKGRYLADQKTHSALVGGKWYTCKLQSVARICKGLKPEKGYYYGMDLAWATKEDERRACDYLNAYSVGSWESDLLSQKYETQLKRKGDKIDALMDEIPCVPDEMEGWIRETVFPDYLFIKRKSKRTYYSCTGCGAQSWKKTIWKHGEETTCPKCGRKAKVWSRGERKDRMPVTLLQTYQSEVLNLFKQKIKITKWVERQFKASCTWRWGEKKEVELFEEIRAVMDPGEHCGKFYYGIFSDTDEFLQRFWDKNQGSKRWLKGLLYPGNLGEVLPVADLERSGLQEMAQAGEKLNVDKWIISFWCRPWVEYLVKGGFPHLAEQVVDYYGNWGNPNCINGDGNSLKECLQIDGNRVNRLKQLGGGLCMLKWLQFEEEQQKAGKNTKISTETLTYLDKKGISTETLKEIMDALGSVNRAANYMRKQKVRSDEFIRIWRDYLRMAEEEGMDPTDDIVRFPKDLKARHDQLVEIRTDRRNAEQARKNATKYAELNKRIIEHLPDAKKYFWENQDYMIIPAGTCEELVHEGQTLHHCVGASTNYMEKMGDGQSWILFLRRKTELEKPYYTIEIGMKEDKIFQWYSAYDRKPDSEKIEKVLKAFKTSLERKRMRGAV